MPNARPGFIAYRWQLRIPGKAGLRARPYLGAAIATLLVPSLCLRPAQAQPRRARPPSLLPACATGQSPGFDFLDRCLGR